MFRVSIVKHTELYPNKKYRRSDNNTNNCSNRINVAFLMDDKGNGLGGNMEIGTKRVTCSSLRVL